MSAENFLLWYFDNTTNTGFTSANSCKSQIQSDPIQTQGANNIIQLSGTYVNAFSQRAPTLLVATRFYVQQNGTATIYVTSSTSADIRIIVLNNITAAETSYIVHGTANLQRSQSFSVVGTNNYTVYLVHSASSFPQQSFVYAASTTPLFPVLNAFTYIPPSQGSNVATNVSASAITTGTLPVSVLPTSGVISGSYGNSNAIPIISVDPYGRVTYVNTAALNASSFSTGTLSASVLPTSGVSSGSYGASNSIPIITVDEYGRVTSVTTTSLSAINASALSGTLSTSLFPTSGVSSGVYGASNRIPIITIDSYGRVTNATTSNVNTDTTNASALTTGTLSTSVFPTSGVSSGTYGASNSIPVITVDTYGRVTGVTTTSLSAINASAITGTLSTSLFPTSGVSVGTYGASNSIPVITVDTYGRVTRITTSNITVDTINASAITGTGTLNPAVLPTSGVVSGTYGSSTLIPTITVDSTGRINTISENDISALLGGGITSNASALTTGTLDPSLFPASGVTNGVYGSGSAYPVITVDATGRVIAAANQTIPPTTNASLLTTGTLSASLLPSAGVSAGSYGAAGSIPSITVDAKGRVTGVTTNSVSVSASSVSGLATVATTGNYNDLSNTTFQLNGSNATFTTGNVGIGTQIPGSQLDVSGNVTVSDTITTSNLVVLGNKSVVNTTVTNTDQLTVINTGTATTMTIYQQGIGNQYGIAQFFNSASNSVMSITNVGYVGIGSTSPTVPLDVNGTAKATLFIGAFSGDGSQLTNLPTGNASNITTGTLRASLLPTSGVTSGTYGTSNLIPIITVDNTGRLTNVSTVTVFSSDYNNLINKPLIYNGSNLYVSSGGNIGVGTITPAAPITVYQSGNITASFYSGSSNGFSNTDINLDDKGLVFHSAYTSNASIYGVVSSIIATRRSAGNYPSYLKFYTAQTGSSYVTERVTIDNKGYVGIGTTTPAYTLDVNGSVNFSSNIYNNGTLSAVWTKVSSGGGSSGNIYYGAGGGGGSSNNVGVGTSSPAQKLHVSGTAAISSSLAVGLTTPVQTLHVQGTAAITGNVGIGTTGPASNLHVYLAGSANTGTAYPPFATSVTTSNNLRYGTISSNASPIWGSGTYVFSASSNSGGNTADNAFDKSANSYWQTAPNTFGLNNGGYYTGSTSTSIYFSSNNPSSNIYGEWVQMQTPIAISLASYTYTPYNSGGGGSSSNVSTAWTLAGSLDGANWSNISVVTGASTNNSSTYWLSTVSPFYPYFRFVVQRCYSSNAGYATVGDITLYGGAGMISPNSWNSSVIVNQFGQVGIGSTLPSTMLDVTQVIKSEGFRVDRAGGVYGKQMYYWEGTSNISSNLDPITRTSNVGATTLLNTYFNTTYQGLNIFGYTNMTQSLISAIPTPPISYNTLTVPVDITMHNTLFLEVITCDRKTAIEAWICDPITSRPVYRLKARATNFYDATTPIGTSSFLGPYNTRASIRKYYEWLQFSIPYSAINLYKSGSNLTIAYCAMEGASETLCWLGGIAVTQNKYGISLTSASDLFTGVNGGTQLVVNSWNWNGEALAQLNAGTSYANVRLPICDSTEDIYVMLILGNFATSEGSSVTMTVGSRTYYFDRFNVGRFGYRFNGYSQYRSVEGTIVTSDVVYANTVNVGGRLYLNVTLTSIDPNINNYLRGIATEIINP